MFLHMRSSGKQLNNITQYTPISSSLLPLQNSDDESDSAAHSIKLLELATKNVNANNSCKCENCSTATNCASNIEITYGKVLGSGSFATIYEAKHTPCATNTSNTNICVKQLVDRRTRIPKDLKRFIHEIYITSLMNHKNCIKLIAFSNSLSASSSPLQQQQKNVVQQQQQQQASIKATPASIWFAMSYCSNGDLYKLLQDYNRYKLAIQQFSDDNPTLVKPNLTTPPLVMKLALELAEALNYVHADLDMVHRDMKSLNVLLSEDFTVKLCDFAYTQRLAKLKRAVQHGVCQQVFFVFSIDVLTLSHYYYYYLDTTLDGPRNMQR